MNTSRRARRFSGLRRILWSAAIPIKYRCSKNAPRPNAAKLFIDFMLSMEGQKLLQDKGRSPGRIGMGAKNPRLKGAKIFTLHVNSENTKRSAKISTGFSSCNDMALKLTMTCGPYDRARALIDGTVKPPGIDLEVHVNKSPGRHTRSTARNSTPPSSTPHVTSPTCTIKRLATRRFPFSSNGCFATRISISTSAPVSVRLAI